MKKWLFSITTFIFSLMICAFVSFYGVLFLAGPHSGIVPMWAEKTILLLGWVGILGLPTFLARKVYVKFR